LNKPARVARARETTSFCDASWFHLIRLSRITLLSEADMAALPSERKQGDGIPLESGKRLLAHARGARKPYDKLHADEPMFLISPAGCGVYS